MKRQYYITKPAHLANLKSDLDDMGSPEFGYHVEVKTGQRTSKQRNAMEVYFRLVAEDMAARGMDMRMVCTLPITPTQANIKENIWKPVMKAVTGKISTTELERDEVSEVYMHMAKALAEKFQCIIAFPEKRR